LMRIQIRLWFWPGSGSCSSSKWCKSVTTSPQTLHGSVSSLHCEAPWHSMALFFSLYSFWILTLMRIRLPKMLRIHAQPNPDPQAYYFCVALRELCPIGYSICVLLVPFPAWVLGWWQHKDTNI
jgi:hypothetical protein